jgi:hypothetical protein
VEVPDDFGWITYSEPQGEVATQLEVESFVDAGKWPGHMRRRAHEIRDEIEQYGGFTYYEPLYVKSKSANSDFDATVVEDTGETEDPETWRLANHQKHERIEDEDAIVTQGKKRINMPIEASKKYSIIDPLADPISDQLAFDMESE